MTQILRRLVWSINAMAQAKNLTKPYQLDTLVGKAVRALADGAEPMVALEVARIAATDMQQCESVAGIVDQLIESVRLNTQSGLSSHQAI